jgi:hypothetical protein
MEEVMDSVKGEVSEFLTCLFQWENWQILGGSIVTNPLFPWFIILVVTFMLVRRYNKKHFNVLRVYTTDRGFIFMKKSALKNVVKKICRELIPQSKSRVKVCTCFRKINVRVSVVCPSNMESVSTQLQRVIFRVLQEEIGINNLGSIHVVVEKIIGPVKVKAIELKSESDISEPLDCKSSCSTESGCCCSKESDFFKRSCGTKQEEV